MAEDHPEETESGTGLGNGTGEVSEPTGGESTGADVDAQGETVHAELERVRDQLLRTAADFDNFRKRSRRELEDAERRGREELLRGLLPVFDNLERAAAHTESATDVQAVAAGIELVMRQFFDALGRLGIERVEAAGKPFDPALHEAIQTMPTADFPPGTVASEVQAGYRIGDRLIRPAMVVVAKASVDESQVSED